MEDGSLAVGLFNLAEMARPIKVDWPLLDLQGKQRIRDLWRQRDIGVIEGSYGTEVPRHGVSLIRLTPVR
jgi:alpha-galactosidase